MTPPLSHPRWRELVAGQRRFPLQNLAARMLITRLRLRTIRQEEAAIVEAIDIAWEFFERNEATTQEDLKAVFGDETT